MPVIDCLEVHHLKTVKVGLWIFLGGRHVDHGVLVCHIGCHIGCHNAGTCHCYDIVCVAIHGMDVNLW